MPGPIRHTLSYKASDFLKTEYRRSPTPEMDSDQPSGSTPARGSRPGRSGTRRRRGRNDWSFSPEKDTDWAMSSVSTSEDESDHPSRISTRSSTRANVLEDTTSAASHKQEDDLPSTGGINFSIGETSPLATRERPPCPDASCPDQLDPICLVPCAVKDFTADPALLDQRLQHQRM